MQVCSRCGGSQPWLVEILIYLIRRRWCSRVAIYLIVYNLRMAAGWSPGGHPSAGEWCGASPPRPPCPINTSRAARDLDLCLPRGLKQRKPAWSLLVPEIKFNKWSTRWSIVGQQFLQGLKNILNFFHFLSHDLLIRTKYNINL